MEILRLCFKHVTKTHWGHVDEARCLISNISKFLLKEFCRFNRCLVTEVFLCNCVERNAFFVITTYANVASVKLTAKLQQHLGVRYLCQKPKMCSLTLALSLIFHMHVVWPFLCYGLLSRASPNSQLTYFCPYKHFTPCCFSANECGAEVWLSIYVWVPV